MKRLIYIITVVDDGRIMDVLVDENRDNILSRVALPEESKAILDDEGSYESELGLEVAIFEKKIELT